MAKSFIIRNFPEDLHRDAKIRAAIEGTTIQALILKALQEYVDRVKQESD